MALRTLFLAAALGTLSVGPWEGAASAALIKGISIPVGGMDAGCRPRNEGVWSVTAPPYPLNVSSGIGYLINASTPAQTDFVLHDHVYIAGVPDPARAVVTYQFNTPAVVDQVHVMEHGNGIRAIEGFVGDSLGSLVSIGTVDIGSGPYPEFSMYTFDFNNATAGRYFRFVIRQTSLTNGYAAYRAYLADAAGTRFDPVPEPATLALLALGGLGLVLGRKRK